MPIRKCLTCQKEFKSRRLANGKITRFCSLLCWGKTVRGKSNKLKGRKFPKRCGSKHPMWKGGRIILEKGYIYIHKPTHPFCNKQGYIMEHRFIMEERLGRFLKPEERVHHINHNTSDNRLKNLILLTDSKHKSMHTSELWFNGMLRTKYPITKGKKECSRCHQISDISNFHKQSCVKSGYRNVCKNCRSHRKINSYTRTYTAPLHPSSSFAS